MINLGGNIKMNGNIIFPGTQYYVSPFLDTLIYYKDYNTESTSGLLGNCWDAGTIGETREEMNSDTLELDSWSNDTNFISSGTKYTFNFWVKWDSYTTQTFAYKFHYHAEAIGSSKFGYTFYYDGSRFNFDLGLNLMEKHQSAVIQPPLNEWVMITLKANLLSPNSYFIYINGVEHPMDNLPDVQILDRIFNIDKFNQTIKYKFDEFGVWGSELSNEDIMKLYNKGNGLTYPFKPH